jgi:hypothetical protein
MDLAGFLKSIETSGLTALIASSKKDSILKTRDGNPARISFAYSPKRVRADISSYKLKKLPEDPEILASFRKYIEAYVNDDCPQQANAFHLSHPVLCNINDKPYNYLEYTVSFFIMQED